MQKFLLNQSSGLLRRKTVSPLLTSMARFQAFSVQAMRFPNEPEGPILHTAFPGPKTQESIAAYGSTSCNLAQQFPVDL